MSHTPRIRCARGRGTVPPRSAARELARDLLGLLWPASCLGCGAADRELCRRCALELRTPVSGHGDVLAGLGAPGMATGVYAGALRAALVAYKHDGAFGLARPLSARLRPVLTHAIARATAARPECRTVIVTVPSRTTRVRERGFRHVDELVRRALLANAAGVLFPRALRATRGRTGQVGLDARARQRNAERVAVRPVAARWLAGRPVVVVDDIVTTGATVRAVVRVLEACGAQVLGVVALAAARRRDSPQKTEWNLTGEKG